MNRTRTSPLDAFGLRDQRNRIYPTMEGSDGSTLSLDFTAMSGLDSRFTFSRTTLATYTNSSGLVAFANHNLVRNSTFTSLTSWTANGTGTTTNANGVLTLSTSAAQTQLYYSQTNAQGFQDNAPVSGRVYSASVQVTSISGGMTYQEVLTIGGSISNVAHYLNGQAKSSSATAETGLITVVWTSGGANTLRIGISASGGTSYANASITMTLPRCVVGNVVSPDYYESPTSTTYHGPRFEFSPTGTSRGLLIEGSATNLLQYSEDFSQTYWNKVNTTISNTSVTCPDGVARTVVRVTDNATSGSHSVRRGFATSAGSTYTLSWFVKKGSTDTFAVQVYWDGTYNASVTVSSIDNNTQTVASGTGVNATVSRVSYPTYGWYRYSMVFTHPSATGAATPDINFCPINNTGTYSGSSNYTDFFGIQLEAGYGASSYIPTLGGQQTRIADQCFISDITALQYSTTNGTLYWKGQFNKRHLESTYNTLLGFMTATDQPTFETFPGGTNSYFAAIRGPSLSTGGLNEISITYPLSTEVRYAASVNTVADPIVRANLNGTTGSANKSGTGDMHVATRFVLGRQPTSSYGGNYPSVTIAQVKYWPTSSTAAQLSALTTP